MGACASAISPSELCNQSLGCCSYTLAQFRTDDCLCGPKYRCYDYLRIEHEDLSYSGATLGDDAYIPQIRDQEVIGGPISENRAPDSKAQVVTTT